MTKRGGGAWRWAAVAAAVLGLAACLPEDLDDLGGGGGGGGPIPFTAGYAFVRSDTRDVYVADDATPNQPQRLTTDGFASTPSLSEDGRRVVYAYNTAAAVELRTVPSDGSANPSTLLALPGTVDRVRFPVFSPDGRTVAFVFHVKGTASDTAALGRVNADGSGFTELARGSGLAFGGPSFLPGGASLLAPAGSTTGSLTSLRRVRVSDGSLETLTVSLTLGSAQRILNRVALSPDGTIAVFDGRDSSGDRLYRINLTTSSSATRLSYNGSDAADTLPSFVNASRVGFGSNAGGNDNVYELSVSASSGAGTLVVPGALEPFHNLLGR